jgi:amino acid adenylation domain-containing protein/non-ribosomal peptide synthase protein (TIGR01720 family)
MSPQQHVLWLLQRGETDPCYRAEGEIHLLGRLDHGALRGAWQRLLRRHEILRTSFRRFTGMAVPFQVIAEEGTWLEVEHDLSRPPASEREARLAEIRHELARPPFDLEQGAVLRTAVVRLGEEHHALLVTLPALCADRTALVNLTAELAAAYAAALEARTVDGQPLQYADFAQWQNEMMASERDARDAAFWQAKVSPRLLAQRLAREPGGRAGDGFAPAAVTLELTADQERALRALTGGLSVSPAAVFLTCWQVLLARLAGWTEVLVGVSCQGRGYEELAAAVGLFAKEVPVVLPLAEERPFADAAVKAQQLLDEADLHQESFHWDLVAGTEVGGGTLPPFFAHGFEDEGAAAPEHRAGGLVLRLTRASVCGARFELKLSLSTAGPATALRLLYDSRLFAPEADGRLLDQLGTLIAGALAAPMSAVGDLEILGGAEREQLLVALNDTRLDLPTDLTLDRHVAAQAARDPERIALTCEGRELTYRDLDRMAARLARHLRARGAGPESVVALYLERSVEMVAAVLAVHKAGGAYLPLEPGLPAARIALMLADARPAVVLAQQRLLAALPAEAGALAIEPLLAPADGEETAAADPETGLTADHLAYVIYTSGSTGRPKAVAVSHRAIANRLLWMQSAFPLGADDRVLFKTPLSFDASIWELFLPLMTGARLVVARHDGQRDAGYLVRTVAEQGVTVLQLVPSLLRVFLEEEGVGRCTCLRRLFCGGEALPTALAERCARLLPSRLCNLYGPTEVAIDATFWEYRGPTPSATVPIGRPIANDRVYLLDRRLCPVPAGVAGELYIGGDGLARGYLGQADRTAERFVPDPIVRPAAGGGHRLYRTGDLARVSPEGVLEFLGRGDHQVKLRGLRIELGEIESALRAHPGVHDAVVLVRGGGAEEPGEPQSLVAYVTHAAGAPEIGSPSDADLTGHLRAHLPEHMVPAVFVHLAALPLLPSGKVDRRALPEPPAARPERRTSPRNADEALLVEIWSGLLRTEVGIDDNFFQLGGDSILAIQVVARARQAGFEIHPRQLFESQTIAGLAGVLRRSGLPVPAAASRPRREAGPLPLTPIQRYFFEQRLPGVGHYNQSVLLDLRRPLPTPVLAAALGRLAAHHAALGLRFTADQGEWRQTLPAAPPAVPLTAIDFAALSGPARHAAVEAVKAAAQASLDLGQGPLFRAVRLEGMGGAGQLLLIAHHLVVDGVSWRVLLEDLAALCAGAEPPAVAASFAAWALAAERLAGSGALAAEGASWLAAPAEPPQPLPVDRQGANTVASARRITAVLGAEETGDLLRKVPAAYRTKIDDTLLAALLRACAVWTGEPSLLVDLEGHGREEIEPGLDLSRTVGWLTAVYPVTLELPADPEAGPGAVLKGVKEQLRAVPGKGIAYGLLRYLGADPAVSEALGARAQAQISWNYLGQLDQSVPDASPFAPAAESPGPMQGPRQPRRYLLEIVAAVVEGRLRVTWTYSAEVHEAATVQRLADEFQRQLSLLIAHCAAPEVGGYTPSDFPLAAGTAAHPGIDQATLDLLTAGLARRIEDVYPLSPVQQGLLFHTLRDPGSGVYFQQLSCALHGPLDIAALTAAWQRAGARHPVLRTSFAWQGPGYTLERPLQIVQTRCELPVVVHDWRGLSAAAQEAALHDFEEQERRLGFDLGRAPLSRLALLRLADDVHQLVWSHHHLILDGWSVPLLIAEVFTAYEALRRSGEPAPVHRPPYRDFIAWLERQDRVEAEAYWRRTLRGLTAPTPLPADRLEAMRASAVGGHRLVTARLGAAATTALREGARRERVTLNTFVQGAWALLLARFAASREAVFGGVTAGRPAELPGVETMLGAFINTLPVRVEIPEERPVGDWLRAVQEQQAELRRFEYAALLDIQGWSEVGRGLPLFDSLLVFESYPIDQELSRLSTDVSFGPVRFSEQTHYPLVLATMPAGDLPVQLDFTAAFDAATAQRLLGALCAVLEELAAQPDRPVESVPLMRQAELHQLLVEWNDSALRFGPGRCLHELFAEQVRRTPGAVALRRAGHPGEDLSYAALDRRADRLACRLRSLGVGPEEIVALCLDRSPELVVSILATMKAGAAYLPLEPSYPAERLELLCAAARPRAVLTRSDLLSRVPAHVPAVLALDVEEPGLAADRHDRPAGPEPLATPESLAYVIFTSGSTGLPKGVMVPHRAIANRVLWTNRQYPLGAADRLLQKTPASFDASIWEIFAPLLAGAVLVLAEPEGHRDPVYLGRTVREEGITVLQLVPSMLRAFAELPDLERCASLTRLFSGGEALPAVLVETLSSRLGAEVVNLYGPTETAIDASSFRCDRGAAASGKIVPIGRPLSNLRIYLLDPAFSPVPLGAPGHLWVGGPSVARGYLGRPDLTAERFVPDPLSRAPGERLYDTGDLARFRADGTLEFLGRADAQVKVRGFRIELAEVEAVLEEHPHVLQAAAAVRGQGQELAAYIVPSGEAPDATELRALLRRKLPEPMVPSSIMVLSELPRTTSGKLDRKALPEPERTVSADGVAAPARLPLADLVATVWEDLLGISGFGDDESFFELGGHSLLAMQLVSRLREACGVEIPIATVFAGPTVSELSAALAAELDAERRSPLPPLVAVPREPGRPLPLSFAQQRLWFMDQLEPGSVAYNILLFLRFEGRLDRAALAGCLEEIVRRHEALRTAFAVVGGEPVQVIAPAGPGGLPGSLPGIDLRALALDRLEAEVTRLAEAEAAQPFELTRGPLLRVRLLETGEEERVLLLALHHIAGDGWSMGLLVEEFAALYRARVEGRQSPLPELPLQYADYAQWQRQWLAGEALESEIAYWQQQLSGKLRAAELPADRPRPAARFHRGAQRPWRVPPELTAELMALCRHEGATLFMLLLAGLDLLLCHYSGEHDVVVGTDVANRGHLGTERLIGFFVNQLVLRTDLSGNPTFVELLRRVRKVTLDAYTHQHVPFERLVERLQPDRDSRRPPFFQLKLVLQHAQGERIELPGLTVRGLEREVWSTAELDFILNLSAGEHGIAGMAYYSADLFDSATIERVLRQLELVLRSAVASPAARLDELLEVLRADDDQRQARLRNEVAPENLLKMRGARRRALAVALPAPDGGSAH